MVKIRNKFSHDKIDIGYSDLDAETTNNGRTYTTPDGKRYPSITTVLSILTEDIIRAWKERVGRNKQRL